MSLVHFAGTVALLRIFLNTTDIDTGKEKTQLPVSTAMYINFAEGKASKIAFSSSVGNKQSEWW